MNLFGQCWAVVLCSAVASIPLAGCAGVPEPLSEAELCARLVSATGDVGVATMDDQFEILARTLPGGFAGVTYQDLFLKQPDYAETVRESARRVGSCPNRQIETQFLYLIQHNTVRKAKYDWVELRHWYAQLFDAGGWATGDISEGINRLSFTFRTQATLTVFLGKARALGVPDDALDLVFSPGTAVDFVAARGQ